MCRFLTLSYSLVMANVHSGEEPAEKKVKISSEKSSPAKAALQASLSAPCKFSGTKKISCLTLDSARYINASVFFFVRSLMTNYVVLGVLFTGDFMRQCTSNKNTLYFCMIFLDGSGEIKGIT